MFAASMLSPEASQGIGSMNDEYDLRRFVRAQENIYDETILALRRGTMSSACMDFIFPSLPGEGDRAGTNGYVVRSLDEAAAYLAFPVIGPRYRECIGALQRLADRSAGVVFGDIGARKLHASLTLFSEASNEFLLGTVFELWFDGLLDEVTMMALKHMSEVD